MKDTQFKQDDENLLQKLFSKYLPYWPWFLIAVLLAFGSAWLFIQYSVPKYEATATLIIKDEKKGNEESKLMESLNQISSKKIVENEIEVLQSRKIMQDVATKLDLYTPVSEKGTFTSRSAFFSSPVIVRPVNPENLQTGLNIPLDYDKAAREVILNQHGRYPINKIARTTFGDFEFIPNPRYQDTFTNKKELFLSVFRQQELVSGLLKNLKVEPAGKLSSIINLSFKDEIPERAELVLNQLISSYRESEINEKNTLARNTLEFINERLALITHDLDTIQQKVQTYKSGSNAVDIGTQGKLYLENVSKNDQLLSEVNTQISVLNQVENFVKNESNGAIVPSTLGVSDPLLTELLTKLNSLELEYEKGKATIGENNPKLIEIREQINKVKPDILKNIGSQKSSLLAMRTNISTTNSAYNSLLSRVPQKERQLIDITRDEQNKRSIYEFLLQKKEESEIAYASTVANNRVVDNAVAGDTPVSPKKLVILAASLAFFIGLVIFYITIRESLNGKVTYRHEIENLTGVPVIGEIVQQKGKKPIAIESGKRSFIAEQFRKLRLSLSFLGIDSSHKKILVTSSVSGEGKSFVASNLAISMTLTGKSVVLVDMDLNNPSQQGIFKTENDTGITEFLQGSRQVSEIIKEVPGITNLFLITSGALPDNPTELIMNGRAAELIGQLNDLFDVVIIDTSPLALVTDGYMLTNLCDATLYVVRHQYTPKVLIRRLDENNNITPIHNPAIVFNGVKQRGYIAETYGYGYGYDYVYGSKKYK